MCSNARPRVTVGMPVYNGGEALRRVLESIAGQTYKNFNLVISDNASTDETENICRELSNSDKRVIYIRQPKNIGAEANFDFVLAKADTEYFMWAAADDVRSSEFIERNVELGRNGVSNSLDVFSRHRHRVVCWLLPMFDFSIGIVRLFWRARLRHKIRIFVILLKVNVITFKWQVQFEFRRRYLRFTRGR